MSNQNQAGKGDKPRRPSTTTKEYGRRYDQIDWSLDNTPKSAILDAEATPQPTTEK